MIICIYKYDPLASVELIITSYQTMKMIKATLIYLEII